MELHIDKEKAKKSINFILEKLGEDADLQLLDEYRKIFTKNVSVFRRSWAAAYLLMHFDQGNTGLPNSQNNAVRDRKPFQKYRSIGGKLQSNSDNPDRTDEKNGENRIRQYTLAEEESKHLFISIGRKRRLFPREILGLIIAKTGISREDIGIIRIFDNYSFVQVRDTVADLVIETLNGFVFRGRTLAINYAKAKKDDEITEENTGDNTETEEDNFQNEDEKLSEQSQE